MAPGEPKKSARSTGPVTLPPSLQRQHIAWFGRTGSGKSKALLSAILGNVASTDGADILIDPKGDGMPREYLRAHYKLYGTLDNVRYFDCAELLPAIPFFDIRPQLAAGVSRTQAVERIVNHYIEILTWYMGEDQFNQAVYAPNVIRFLIKALFDPEYGSDAFPHRRLVELARRIRETGETPPVSDPELDTLLQQTIANDDRTFERIMTGVIGRLQEISADRRLARLFNHVPEDEGPQFALREILNEDTVVILDLGSLQPEGQRVLTLAFLSKLWDALQARTRRHTDTVDPTTDQPLVNCYIEEAGSIAISDLLEALLAQSRAFDLSVTLAMQAPQQVGPATDTYHEIMNNVGTIIAGPVTADEQLCERFATANFSKREVRIQLQQQAQGTWLCTLAGPYGQSPVEPFLAESAPLPPGDPDGEYPLSPTEADAFESAVEETIERTAAQAGLRFDRAARQDARSQSPTERPDPLAVDTDERLEHVDTLLPYTRRFPEGITVKGPHTLACEACDNRFEATPDGMRRALDCHGEGLEGVDRDDIPPLTVALPLTPAERAAIEFTDRQLLFLQLVTKAHRLQFDPAVEYDPVWDSMQLFLAYLDIERSAVEELVEAGLLRRDCDHPHQLFSPTHEGLALLNSPQRQDLDFGEGAGDLDESTLHRAMVEVGRRYLNQAYVADPASPVETVSTYYEIDTDSPNNARLDAVGLDEDGEIVVTVEAERINNDLAEAALTDFDKMADQDPEAAIWIVPTRSDGHELLEALSDPVDDSPRVEKSYSSSTPPSQFRIDTPGLTEMYTLTRLRDQHLDDRHGSSQR